MREPIHALRLQACLVDEDHSDEPHRRRQEEERAVAHLVHLLDDDALLAPAADRVIERPYEDGVELAGADEQIDRRRAQRADEAELLVLVSIRRRRRHCRTVARRHLFARSAQPPRAKLTR
jgi:hypothetical protein